MVVIDTDVIIASIRGNEIAKQLIRKHMPGVCISVVTEMELHIGANDTLKKKIVTDITNTHQVLFLNKNICEIAVRLVRTYNTGNKSLFLSDALIAATCLYEHSPLVTFNTKDFKFIKGLQLSK